VSEQNYSLVIDLDQKMVDFGMVGAHKIPITSVGDSQFLFNDGLGEPLLYREGEIDRITGKVHLFISQAHFPPNDYYLQCKPAKPLF
jgi:hypothetical protein